MSCYRCADKFKLFNREVGCPNCGFGFCSKCCNNKINVPKKGNQLLKVCFNCYEQLSNKVNPSEISKETTPPKNFLKLVESNKQNKPSNSSSLLSTEDQQLADRLEKLKNQNKPDIIPTDKDLTSRLRNLQGTNVSTNLSNLPSKETIKTPDDLMTKIMDEVTIKPVEIEKKHGDFEKQEIEKLEKRLKNLSANVNLSNSDKPSEPVTTKPQKLDPADEIMQKLLKEAEEIQKKSFDDEEISCCLCNDDSIVKLIRCIDCDNDIYCSRCLKQTHNTGEYKRHRQVKVESSMKSS